jgi:hypothetical protein
MVDQFFHDFFVKEKRRCAGSKSADISQAMCPPGNALIMGGMRGEGQTGIALFRPMTAKNHARCGANLSESERA